MVKAKYFSFFFVFVFGSVLLADRRPVTQLDILTDLLNEKMPNQYSNLSVENNKVQLRLYDRVSLICKFESTRHDDSEQPERWLILYGKIFDCKENGWFSDSDSDFVFEGRVKHERNEGTVLPLEFRIINPYH